jgi:hypothetical protein
MVEGNFAVKDAVRWAGGYTVAADNAPVLSVFHQSRVLTRLKLDDVGRADSRANTIPVAGILGDREELHFRPPRRWTLPVFLIPAWKASSKEHAGGSGFDCLLDQS